MMLLRIQNCYTHYGNDLGLLEKSIIFLPLFDPLLSVEMTSEDYKATRKLYSRSSITKQGWNSTWTMLKRAKLLHKAINLFCLQCIDSKNLDALVMITDESWDLHAWHEHYLRDGGVFLPPTISQSVSQRL
jgi:hypothetical protein